MKRIYNTHHSVAKTALSCWYKVNIYMYVLSDGQAFQMILGNMWLDYSFEKHVAFDEFYVRL